MRKVTMMVVPLGTAVLMAIYFAHVGAAQDRKEVKHTKWEYKILNVNQIIDLAPKPKADDRRNPWEVLWSSWTKGLNILGDDGWELVSVSTEDILIKDTRVYIFKRPK